MLGLPLGLQVDLSLPELRGIVSHHKVRRGELPVKKRLARWISSSERLSRLIRDLVVEISRKKGSLAWVQFSGNVIPNGWSFKWKTTEEVRSNLRFYSTEEGRELLTRIQKYSDETERLASHVIQPDLWDLAQQAQLMKMLVPRKMVEFGSGVSTVVGILYAQDFFSAESDEDWRDVTRAGLLAAGFSEKQSGCVTYSPAQLSQIGGETCWVSENVPEGPVDFVYLDGPPLNGWVSADPVWHKLINRNTVILIDGRTNNTRWLYERLSQDARDDWKHLAAPYPSNDSILISSHHPKFTEVKARLLLTEVRFLSAD